MPSAVVVESYIDRTVSKRFAQISTHRSPKRMNPKVERRLFVGQPSPQNFWGKTESSFSSIATAIPGMKSKRRYFQFNHLAAPQSGAPTKGSLVSFANNQQFEWC